MVGALILALIAVATFFFGIPMFFGAETDDQALRGLMLCVISVICLSAALVIDGVRYYAKQLSNQMGWLMKPAGSLRASIDRPSSSNGDASLARYHVVGNDQATGLETELVVQVADETEALKAGERRGIEVKRVELAS